MHRLATLITILVLAALPTSAFALLDVEMAVGGWQQDPSGTLAYQLLSATDKIDLEQDAKYDDETAFWARAKVELPLFLPNIYVMATPMSFDGTGNKTINFNFGGTNFDATLPFTSEVKLDHYDVALFWGIPMLKTATLNRFDIEYGINVRLIDFEGTVTGTDTVSGLTVTETTTESLAIPMIYLGAEFAPVKSFAIQAEIRAIEYSDSSYYDYIGRVRFKPFKTPLFVGVGYRFEDIDIDEKDILAEVEFSGPFAEVGLKF